jgi:hypothetical protein
VYHDRHLTSLLNGCACLIFTFDECKLRGLRPPLPSRFLGGPDGRIAITVLVVFAERKNGKNAARLLRTFPRQGQVWRRASRSHRAEWRKLFPVAAVSRLLAAWQSRQLYGAVGSVS